jgi:hypothetical protein
MDIQNIQLYKYLTDHDKTMNREKMFLQRKERGRWMERNGRRVYLPPEYKAESMAHKQS